MMEQSLIEPGLLKALDKYVGAIKETETYKKYKGQLEVIKEYPEKYQRIKAFQLKNFEVQNTMSQDELYDKMVEFERESEELEEDPIINGFMHTELAFCRMIQDASTLITEKLDFDSIPQKKGMVVYGCKVSDRCSD